MDQAEAEESVHNSDTAQLNGISAETVSTIQPISADEIALYDRQIRLWGVQAQQRLRSADILLIGIRGLGAEVAKNLVLAGIGSLTIVDDEPVTEDDLGAQFFISEEHIGICRSMAALPQIQRLNPRVALHTVTFSTLSQDPSYYASFAIVIATDLSLATLSTINAACRMANRPFYAASTFGMFGYIFADLISHEFVISRDKSNVPTQLQAETATRSIIGATTRRGDDGRLIELVTKREIYSPIILANTSPLPPWHLANRRRRLAVSPLLACLRALWDFQALTQRPAPAATHADLELFTTLATEKQRELQLPPENLRADFLRAFLQNLGCELNPVCAFLGGQLAQEVINVVGGKEQPIQNLLLFDADDSKGPVYAMHPIFPPLDGDPPLDPSAFSLAAAAPAVANGTTAS